MLRLWSRRGLGPWLALLMVGFLLWSIVTNRPWRLEFDWGLRYLAASVYVFAPLVAACAAYDVGGRSGRDWLLIGRTTRRGVATALAPSGAITLWAVSAVLLSWAAVALVVSLAQGIGPSDALVAVEMVSALAAAAVVGAVVGVLVEGLLAVAVSAGGVVLAAMMTSGAGSKLFQVATSTGSLIGIERTPARALVTIASNTLVVAMGCLAVALKFRSTRHGSRLLLVPLGIVLMTLVLVSRWPFTASEFRESTQPTRCVGKEVTLCGPAHASPVLDRVAVDLSAALTRLQPSGLSLPTRFAIARGGDAARVPDGVTPISLETEDFTQGHLPIQAMAEVFSVPRPCAAFDGDDTVHEYLAQVTLVRDWITLQLTSDSPVVPAPDTIRAAFQRLATCPRTAPG